MSYPQYAASLFAGNDFFRSLFAFGSVLFSRSMYVDLGVGKGLSLLGGLSVMGIVSTGLGQAQREDSLKLTEARLEYGCCISMERGCERARSLRCRDQGWESMLKQVCKR